jgi:hypothetical protein
MRNAIPVLGLLVLLAAAPAQAIVSFGVYGGIDVNGQDAEDIERFEFEGSTESVSLTREEISAPIMGGIYVLVDATPFIDVEVGVEASFTKYDVSYTHYDGVTVLQDYPAEEGYFGRIGATVSGKLNMLSLPTMKGYVGAGLGYHLIAPLLSGELLEDQIVNEGLSGNEIAADEVVDRAGAFGGHLLAGAKFKIPVLPFSLRAEGRYYFVGENDFGDDTNNFLSATVGLGIGF